MSCSCLAVQVVVILFGCVGVNVLHIDACRNLYTLTVGIWSIWHSGGPVLQGLNTRGCEVPGRTTQQLVLSNQLGNKEELLADVDCWMIAILGDSLVVIVSVSFAVCCMLDTVNDKAVSCTATWDDVTNKEIG